VNELCDKVLTLTGKVADELADVSPDRDPIDQIAGLIAGRAEAARLTLSG
jgi:serine/threonine-protein kinase HipA